MSTLSTLLVHAKCPHALMWIVWIKIKWYVHVVHVLCALCLPAINSIPIVHIAHMIHIAHAPASKNQKFSRQGGVGHSYRALLWRSVCKQFFIF